VLCAHSVKGDRALHRRCRDAESEAGAAAAAAAGVLLVVVVVVAAVVVAAAAGTPLALRRLGPHVSAAVWLRGVRRSGRGSAGAAAAVAEELHACVAAHACVALGDTTGDGYLPARCR